MGKECPRDDVSWPVKLAWLGMCLCPEQNQYGEGLGKTRDTSERWRQHRNSQTLQKPDAPSAAIYRLAWPFRANHPWWEVHILRLWEWSWGKRWQEDQSRNKSDQIDHPPQFWYRHRLYSDPSNSNISVGLLPRLNRGKWTSLRLAPHSTHGNLDFTRQANHTWNQKFVSCTIFYTSL